MLEVEQEGLFPSFSWGSETFRFSQQMFQKLNVISV